MEIAKEYLRIDSLEGPLMVLSGVENAAYGEIIKIRVKGGKDRLGKIIRLEDQSVVAQVFEGTSGLSSTNASVRFTGRPFELIMSPEILGRAFDGTGRPIDGGGPIYGNLRWNINGRPINPVARKYPRDYIETGVARGEWEILNPVTHRP